MTRCKYCDCGWCYCKTGNSNDINGKCMTPMECQQLASQQQPQQHAAIEDKVMSNEKMREEFEAWASDSTNLWLMPVMLDGEFVNYYDEDTASAFNVWQASRAARDGYCIVPSETIKKAYALASSVCGDCYAGENAESLLANQLTKEISKSEYWMNMK